ncbi:tetratricopeptide repeat protein, partial [Escherichia coli]|uniref:tetratricopeptide repeat protein n=1 Tax=Escherichia coli TaxID=562 RepID=UPI00128FCA4C|nr:tetratricopeptide repeat protein [Escherichia coli]
YAEAWSNKGVALYDLKRYNEALNCAERALRINPTLTSAYRLRELCLKALGK